MVLPWAHTVMSDGVTTRGAMWDRPRPSGMGFAAHAATFRLTGTPNQAISISNVTLSFPGAGSNLGTVAAESPVARDGSTTQLPADGDDDLFIGGRIDVSPTTNVATYTGTLSLTVDFN